MISNNRKYESGNRTKRVDILHLTSAHPVSDTRIFVKEARTLAGAGYQTAILGPSDVPANRQVKEFVQVYTLKRPQNRFARFTTFARKLYRTAVFINPQIVHIHDPDLILIAWLMKRRGIKIVYDVHEDFPKAILSRSWLGPRIVRNLIAKCLVKLEQNAAIWLDGIVLADTQLTRRFPIERSVVVRNYLDMREWKAPFLSERDHVQPLKCIYVGDISEPRGLTRMCDAIQEATASGLNASLELIGHVSQTQKEAIANHPAAPHIVVHGWGTRSEVASKLARSNIAFCLLEPNPAYREALPVKVLEYIASGLSVVATDLPRLRQESLLEDAIQFVPWDAPSGTLANAISKAGAADKEQRQRMQAIVNKHYNWLSEAGRLIKLYERLLK